jgi:Lar family restriction alleviation protein
MPTITDEEYQELKPCPHCGTKNVRLYNGADGIAGYEVYCDNCTCLQSNAAEAITAWNTRAYEAEMQDLMRVKRENKKLKRLEKKLNDKIANLKKRAVVFPYNYVLRALEELLK